MLNNYTIWILQSMTTVKTYVSLTAQGLNLGDWNHMDCVQVQQMVRPYMDGVLSDRELQEFLDHIQKCPACFSELEIYFSIHRTLNNVDEKGDYNYARKLRAKLEESRAYLRVRTRNRILKLGVILIAEVCAAAALYGLFFLPGGYISRHHTEIIPVLETEASADPVPETDLNVRSILGEESS